MLLTNEEVKKLVIAFLNAHSKAVFATIDAEGKPATSLMLYSIDDSLNVYFGTRKAFKKYDQLKQNPNIALSVIEEKLDPLRVVDVRGVAVELSPEEQATWHDHFKSKNTSTHYVEGAADYVMFRIHPASMRWLDASSGELAITEVAV